MNSKSMPIILLSIFQRPLISDYLESHSVPKNFKTKGDFMPNKNLEHLVINIKDAVKNMHIKDGDIYTLSDEHYRLRVSPYRLTMEIRFPEGINNMKEHSPSVHQ